MVFDKGRHAALAIEVVSIGSFDVDFLADSCVGKRLSCLAPAEIDRDHGQSVVLLQVSQCCIVGSVENIKNQLNRVRPYALHQQPR